MARRGRAITVVYYAVNYSTGANVSGDVANHTLRYVKDGASSAPTNAPAEIDATNAPGAYKLVLTNAETNCSVGYLVGKSSTVNVQIVPTVIYYEDEEVLLTIRLLRQWVDWIRGKI